MRRCRSKLMQNMEFVRHICAKRCPCAQRMTQFWRNNNNNNNQPFTSQLFFSFFYFVSFSYLCFIIHFIHALVRLSRWIHQMHKCTCRNMARMAHTIAITANYTELNTNTHTVRWSRLNQIKWRKTWQIVQQQTETNLALIWMCKIEINVEQSHTHRMHKMHNAHQWTWTSIRTSMAKRCERYVCHKLCARLRQTTRFIKLKKMYIAAVV